MKTAATLLALFTFALAAPLGAAPLPVNSAQAPGYYRMMLGDWQITAVSDGTVTIPADKLLTRITPDALKTRLADDALTPQVETSINAYVINTGDKLILVDSGAGALLGNNGGHLPENLRAAGIDPSQIDTVLLTHIHADHSGGVQRDGKPVFPNAPCGWISATSISGSTRRMKRKSKPASAIRLRNRSSRCARSSAPER